MNVIVALPIVFETTFREIRFAYLTCRCTNAVFLSMMINSMATYIQFPYQDETSTNEATSQMNFYCCCHHIHSGLS
jgi:hypothetical protein